MKTKTLILTLFTAGTLYPTTSKAEDMPEIYKQLSSRAFQTEFQKVNECHNLYEGDDDEIPLVHECIQEAIEEALAAADIDEDDVEIINTPSTKRLPCGKISGWSISVQPK